MPTLAGRGSTRILHLANAKVYTLKLSDAVFTEGSSIHLKDFNFNRIVVRWNSIKDHLPFNGSVYLTLIKNFRNLEQFEDEDDCYYQYRKEKQARTQEAVPKLLDRLAWLSCGYGVRPSHTILLSLAIILLFTGIFWAGNALQPESADQQSHLAAIPAYRSTMPSTSAAWSFWAGAPEFEHRWRAIEFLTVIETLMGWLLMALFLVTLSKVMLR